MKIVISSFFLLWTLVAVAQNEVLQSGPMLGYAEMREVMIWVQTKKAAKLKIRYWEKGKPNTFWESQDYTTQKENAFVAKIAVEVEPASRYQYDVYVNNKKISLPYALEFQSLHNWHWRTDAPDFSFIFGSCNYVNEERFDRLDRAYGSNHKIFTTILSKKPDFMLWGGDNVYLREADWGSKQSIQKRYTHTRSLPEMQALLASVHHYATWDDHDFGNNDSDGSFVGKKWTQEIFRDFWANPNFNVNEGITGSFRWADAEFFLLDNRSFRSPNNRRTGNRQILGDEQIEWLIDALSGSSATFKFVVIGGQFVNAAKIFENHANFPEERQKILDLLAAENIKGVLFLTGDRHHTVLMKMEREQHYPLYELTCSSFTAGSHAPTDKNEEKYRVVNTLLVENNFSQIQISGKPKDRSVLIKVFDVEGKEVWQYKIHENELR